MIIDEEKIDRINGNPPEGVECSDRHGQNK
jgi:hypothetical protein